ncbi:MAG: helix-turn-helix transcriptional regulator, partial [Verrucomicrobia bacterium]|nr:helix-turn-helix transcriptional regulator [Verrucomicrobiota bacterium]
PALQRLERKGWITSAWGVSDHHRKAKFYRLTPAGRKQLGRETTDWQKFSGVIDLILRTA